MKKNILVLLLLSCAIGLSQNPVVDSLETALKEAKDDFGKAHLQLELAKTFERIDIDKGKEYALKALVYTENDSLSAEIYNQLGRFCFFTAKLDSATLFFERAKDLLIKAEKPDRVAAINISLGAIQLRQGDYNKTIRTLTESAAFFEGTKDSVNMGKCYSNIATAFAELNQYPKAIEYSEKALVIFRRKKQTQFEMITLPNLATQYFKNGDTVKAIGYNAEAEALATSLGDKRSLSMVYNNLGNIYLDKDPDRALGYLEETLKLKNQLKLVKGIEITQSNLGYIHLKKKEYTTAISYFNKAAKQVKGKQLVFVYNNLKEAYLGKGLTDKALEYSERSRTLNDSILNSEFQKNFAKIQTRYETEKKEKEILKLTAINQEIEYKRITNRNFFISALAALFITLGIAYLLVKNSKRKRLIAIQQEKIISHDFEQQLKTQELNGIDAIIDAQEKEREKIAADLHDNLGSKVATLKLYLESYEEQKENVDFFQKIKTIAEETYHEIRKTAQSKNFGAFISKGLIPSTQAVADQISETNTISIKVHNIDVEKRIDNTIEIQLFRVIQELLTNIIKHAVASEVIIQFSEDDNQLTVLVEDNGKGFDIHAKSSGMGLQNIETRLQKIEGDIVIDSSEGNGTTIILTIPL